MDSQEPNQNFEDNENFKLENMDLSVSAGRNWEFFNDDRYAFVFWRSGVFNFLDSYEQMDECRLFRRYCFLPDLFRSLSE